MTEHDEKTTWKARGVYTVGIDVEFETEHDNEDFAEEKAHNVILEQLNSGKIDTSSGTYHVDDVVQIEDGDE